ncbi:MAG TPA: Crp/Fnr family transcriptional regulator [Mesorhizobium sp.]|jgi:CRP-like cAMP-binding protein|nr:Crp/Fnr family transcriptional regulator [Mesorhizobium sp.]
MLAAEGTKGNRATARFEPALFDRLFAGCRVERFAPGHYLFMQDDCADRLFGVVSGTIEISILSPEGQKLIANIELPRSLVGEIGALDGGRRTASAMCMGACEVVSIGRAQLMERVGSHPELARAMIELLCARLRWVSGEFGDQAFLDIEARLAKRLLLLSARLADAEGWIHISQSELADFLGATRESVNKTLSEWRAAGLVELKRAALRISRASALRKLAETEM